jgi:hypothetical protein
MLGFSMTALSQTEVTVHWNGTLTGPDGLSGIYGGTINGTTTAFTCDDYPDHITPVGTPETWSALVYNLNDLGNGVAPPGSPLNPNATGNPTGVRFPNPNGQTTLAAYTEVAWLAQSLFNPSVAPNHSAAQEEYSWAIWTILDTPGTDPNSADDSTEAALVTDAKNWYANCTANWATAQCTVNNLNIYTPIAGTAKPGTEGYPQEFISEGSAITITPEPLSMALMGTFLTLAGLGLGKKKLFT